MIYTEKLSDHQLIAAVKENNYRAFNELYDRYKHILFSFIARLSQGDYTLAEDIVQQTFMTIWEQRAKLHIDKSVQSYLKVISKNLFLKETYKRIHDELRIAMLTEELSEEENSVEEEVELNLLLENIEQIISQLSPARQRVYRMKHIEHLTQKEIASQLGISENTVENHLKYSNKYLQLMLRNTYKDYLNMLAVVSVGSLASFI